MVQRRDLLKASAMSIALLATACVTNTNPATNTSTTVINPQILADAQSVVKESSVIVTILNQSAATKISNMTAVTTAEAAASAALAGLSSVTLASAGATTLQKILTDINTILDAAGPVLTVVAAANPQIAAAVDAYDLIVPFLPAIESWVVSILTPGTASVRKPRNPIHTHYTQDQARAKLATFRG